MIEQIIDGRTDLVLAHGEHRIHPLHEELMLKDHGFGFSSGMEINLLGKMHLERNTKPKTIRNI